MADVDRAARRYWRTMMRLGMFDSPENQPMVMDLGAGDVDSPAARALAQKTAAEGIVLLKNDGILPMDGGGGRLDAKTAKLAFIGPATTMTQDLLSAPQYHGQNRLVETHSPLMVAQARGWQVTYSRGCNICDWVPKGYPNQPCSVGPDGKGSNTSHPDTSNITAAATAAKAADVAILFLGADQTTEAENFDRETLGLVGAQEELLAAVAAVQKNVVVVLIHGGPIAVESAQASASVRAIVDAFQPGELGADAIMDILTGVTSPSGRMPYTTYFKNFTKRDIREVNLTAGDGLTYWWHTAPVLYPFGWGLSFTHFSFAWSDNPPSSMRIPSLSSSDMELRDFAADHHVNVTNIGSRTSDVVVLAFVVRTSESPSDTPLRKLFGFERFHEVAPGESRIAYFAPNADAIGVVDENGDRFLQPGTYGIECIGMGDEKVTNALTLIGEPLLVEPSGEWLNAAKSTMAA